MNDTINYAILKGPGEVVTFSWAEGEGSVRIISEYPDGTSATGTHRLDVAREVWTSLKDKGYQRIGH